MFSITTKASGNFKVYIPDNYGKLDLIADSDNLITNAGLNGVASKNWTELFQLCLAGSGTSDPTFGDTAMEVLELTSNVQPLEPASYSSATYSSVDGATYIFGKTFKLENLTGGPKTITELGTGTSIAGGGYNLFSRVKLPSSFTLEDKKFAYVVYELRLSTGVSTTRLPFQVNTDGPSTFLFPSGANLGIFNCPFATLLPNGTVTGNTFTSGHAMFEPSNSNYYLYKLNAAPVAGYFTNKRNYFETQSNLLATSNAATGANPAYVPYSPITGGYQLIPENSSYVADSFKKSYHLIISPSTPPPATPEAIYGFALSNCSVAATIPNVGLHCIFPSKWDRPPNSFFKIYFEQNWNRA